VRDRILSRWQVADPPHMGTEHRSAGVGQVCDLPLRDRSRSYANFCHLVLGVRIAHMRSRSAIALTMASLAAVGAAGQAFAPTGSLTFEVASIKPTKPGSPDGGVHPAPGGQRYVGSNWVLRNYLSVAYQVKPEQITGGAGWVDTEPYDLNAEAEKPSSIEDLHVMLQNLLTERFKLRFHHGTKEMSAYALTVDKGGPRNLKVHPAPSGGDLNINKEVEQFLHEKWNVHCASMGYFTFVLAQIFDRPVLNQTGVMGCYDFVLTFTRDLPPGFQEGQLFNGAPIDTSGPTIFQALQSQLGLKLESKKAPVDTMVIDHAERPEEN